MHDYLVGVVSGVISGLIVAGVLALFRAIDKPRFEAVASPDNTVTIFNNRWHPAVIGGTFAMCVGAVVSEKSPRGGQHGILLLPRTSTVLKRSEYLTPGETFDMTIRYIPLWRRMVRRYPVGYRGWQMDPTQLRSTSGVRPTRRWHCIPIMLKSA